MKKQQALAVISLALLCLALLFSAACKSANSFVGTWKPTADSDPGMKVDSLTIKEDGTFSMHPAGSGEVPDLTGKWKADGKKISFTPDRGSPFDMNLDSDGRLTISERGHTGHFAKS